MKKEKTYIVTGHFTTAGGQDDDGIHPVNRSFLAPSDNKALIKFVDIVEESKNAILFCGSKKSAVMSVHLKLIHGKRQIKKLNLRNEKVRRITKVKPRRGWIDLKKWTRESYDY